MGIRITQQQSGFTIIEISLFLAVSGIVLVGMLTGISVSIQHQRFSESVNGLQSFLQLQYNETQITINGRSNTTDKCSPSADRGSTNCLIVGKVIDLNADPASGESSIKAYRVLMSQVAADTAKNSDTPPSDDVLLNQSSSDTKVVNDTANNDSFIVPWGATLTKLQDSRGSLTPSGTVVRYIFITRSPISGLINTYKLSTLDDLFSPGNDHHNLAGEILTFEGASNQSIKACIQSADITNATALLIITTGSTQSAVTTQFDTNERDSWCNS